MHGGAVPISAEWALRTGSVGAADSAMLAGLGLDGTGRAVLAVNFAGKTNLGSTTYDTGSAGSQGFAFGRYDSMGKWLWDAGFVTGTNLEDQTVSLLAVGSSGGFVALGAYESSGLDFGSGVTIPGVAPAPIDVFTVQFSASDTATSAHAYGNASGLNAFAFGGLATDSFGARVVAAGAGQFGTYALGPATIHNDDLFIVNLTSNWGNTYNDGGSADAFAGVVTDAKGDVFAAGQHHGTLDFGGGPANSATAGDGFVLALDATGSHTWDKSFAAAPDALAIDAAGDVVVCGEFSGSVDFGLGPLTSTGEAVFVAKLGPSGVATWNEAFAVSDAMSVIKTFVTTDSMGNTLLGANAPGATIDFGGGALSASFLVAKLDPSGAHVWSKGFGVGKLDRVIGIAAYDAHQILLGHLPGNARPEHPRGIEQRDDRRFLAKLILP